MEVQSESPPDTREEHIITLQSSSGHSCISRGHERDVMDLGSGQKNGPLLLTIGRGPTTTPIVSRNVARSVRRCMYVHNVGL